MLAVPPTKMELPIVTAFSLLLILASGGYLFNVAEGIPQPRATCGYDVGFRQTLES